MDIKPAFKATCSNVPCQLFRWVEAPSESAALEALALLGWSEAGCAKCSAVVR